MNTSYDDNATTWRELADQLTENQRSSIARLEQELDGRASAPEYLLSLARDCIEGNLTDMAYSDIPAPAGTTWVGDWEKNLKQEGWSRSLVWWRFGASDLHIDGSQQCDGSYNREIALYAAKDDCTRLDSAGARRLAASLVAAAAELDRLNVADVKQGSAR